MGRQNTATQLELDHVNGGVFSVGVGMSQAVRSDSPRLRQEHESGPNSRGELTLCVVAAPADIDPSGDISGGGMMTQTDLAGELDFTQRAEGRMVTCAVHGMYLFRPVKVGDMLRVDTSVEHVGRTLMTISVKAKARCFRTHVRE